MMGNVRFVVYSTSKGSRRNPSSPFKHYNPIPLHMLTIGGEYHIDIGKCELDYNPDYNWMRSGRGQFGFDIVDIVNITIPPRPGLVFWTLVNV